MDTLNDLFDRLRNLSADELRKRVAELDAERKQVSVLLRAAAARERIEREADGRRNVSQK